METTDYMGQIISVTVTDENEQDYFAQKDGVTFRIEKSEFDKPHQVTDAITGFAYENEEHELQLTTKLPMVKIGHYAWATVVASRRDLGVFVDIGLPNKDIVVSSDLLPTIHHLWPAKGDQLLVSLIVDKKGRLWGQLADEDIFQEMAKKATQQQNNSDVQGIIYRLKIVGSFLLTDEKYIGFIHPSERDAEPRIGQKLKARVIGVRPDGVLNLSLRPRAYEAISDDSAMILAVLKHQPGNVMAYTDKSDPEAIREFFGISKGQFKRALGHLMKLHLVEQADGKTHLLGDPDQPDHA
ncbi:S1 RNA-binding domain-containing protein [Loigolactobacillus backii]|uniref:DNA-binding protein n=1 Tax=Loigolactobacillus backii TaxID=375175 RepID=A0A192H3M0_9LACO|nr:S1-like domain-containing RNA-binding protein [Loigolactobacillus backii]ANK59581.1 DNA-binding protein [Loigolactobacillus backii]ANK62853.1 DNA-binding protein [Loigolactobacillus backii]ANK64575.1 DNA-binding protein [Loigolactobacillus backii]ANK67030.1 DNA-binding protein [Loigolactobacillus backii]ANK70139.1 DNA-binding protein [Loigolactobacillus backii]